MFVIWHSIIIKSMQKRDCLIDIPKRRQNLVSWNWVRTIKSRQGRCPPPENQSAAKHDRTRKREKSSTRDVLGENIRTKFKTRKARPWTPHTLGSKWRFAQRIKLKAFDKVFLKHSSNIEFVFQLEGLGLKPPSSHSSRNIYIPWTIAIYRIYPKNFFWMPSL